MSIVLIGIYVDSFVFVYLTAILTKGFNMNILDICRGTILLCKYFDPFPKLSDCKHRPGLLYDNESKSKKAPVDDNGNS